MPYTIITGTFHVVGSSPDGDSIHFAATNDANWQKLSSETTGPAVSRTGRFHAAQLRFEGIDALETHYQPPGGHTREHQPLQYAEAARDRVLELLTIDGVHWGGNGVITRANDGKPGYILSRSVDPYHRPIAFVYAGNQPPGQDGDEFRLDVQHLQQSVNYQLLQEGLVFPTYYKGLYFDLRNALTAGMRRAKQAGDGLWPQDHTTTGIAVPGLTTLTNDAIVLPKLFRRIAEYLATGGGVDAGFLPFLQSKQGHDEVLVLSDRHFTHLDNLVEVIGDSVRLLRPPEDLVFQK